MVIVAGHGPFTWGKSAMDAVHYAAALEEVGGMAILTYQVNPSAGPLPEHVMAKHYEPSTAQAPYYGQPNSETIPATSRASHNPVVVARLRYCGVVAVVLATYWPALSAGALYMDDKFYLETALMRHPSWTSMKTIFGDVLAPSVVQGFYSLCRCCR